MARDDSLTLTIEARDKASKEIDAVGQKVRQFGTTNTEIQKILQRQWAEHSKSIQNAGKEIDQLTNSAKKSSSGFAGMTSSIIKGGLALGGITIALQQVNQFLRDSVREATNYQNSMAGTISLIRAFGLEENQLKGSIQSLTQDGLLTQADAMKSLQNLLAGGLNIAQATKLIGNYKDLAAFGRDTTISFADAVKNNSEAFLTEMSILGNRAGLQENFNQIIKIGAQEMGKSVVSLNANERAQAKMIGTELVAQRATGNSQRLADSYVGTLIRQQNAVTNLKIEVGNSLLPALAQLSKLFLYGSTSGEFLTKVIRGVGVVAVAVAGGIRILITSIVDMGRAVAAFFGSIGDSIKQGRADFSRFNDELDRQTQEMGGIFTEVGKSISDVWNGVTTSVGDMSKANRDYMTEMSDQAKKSLEEIAKEMRNYQRQVADLAKQYDENMRDMIVSHKEKVDKIKSDIDEENAKFTDDLAERKKSYDKAMKDLEDRHAEKVQKIKDQMTDEKADFDKQSEEIADKWQLVIDDFKKNANNRLSFLQSQLDKEVAKQSYASKQRIEMIQRMIDEEKVALVDHERAKEDLRDEEIDKARDEYQKQANDLQKQLDDEVSSFKEASNDKLQTYRDETAQITKEHDKRKKSLENELNVELALQKTHADVFSKFQDAVAEDDIARLKRKNAEERAELERAHQERLQDIQRQVQEQRATQEAGQVRSSGSNASSQVAQAKAEQQRTSAAVSSMPTAVINGQSIPINLSPAPTSASSAQPSSNTSGGGFFSSIAQGATNIFNSIRKTLGFAEGGEFTVPGAGGRDSQLMSMRVTPGERVKISPSGLRGGDGGVTINMPVTMTNTEMDVTTLVERLSWELNKQGII